MPRSSRGTRLAGHCHRRTCRRPRGCRGARSLRHRPIPVPPAPAFRRCSPGDGGRFRLLNRGERLHIPDLVGPPFFLDVFQSSVGSGSIHQLTDGRNSGGLRTSPWGLLRTTAVTSGLPRASCRAAAPTPCLPFPAPGRRPIPATPPGATGTLRFSSGLLRSRGPQPRKARRELADRA